MCGVSLLIKLQTSRLYSLLKKDFRTDVFLGFLKNDNAFSCIALPVLPLITTHFTKPS